MFPRHPGLLQIAQSDKCRGLLPDPRFAQPRLPKPVRCGVSCTAPWTARTLAATFDNRMAAATMQPMGRHRIHLRGPWQFAWLERWGCADGGTAEGRVKLPNQWPQLLQQANGRLRMTRRFGRPANLEPEERVLLFVERIRCGGQVRLNGQCLLQFDASEAADDQPLWADVTSLLQSSNWLEITVELPDVAANVAQDGLWSGVGIEIRTPDAATEDSG